ncbi:TPA: beta 1-4 rhamnosyltransferase Cps2T [Streptococcus suis]
MKSVYIVGSKGIPAKYGGFETFVDNLISNQQSENIQYFVACMMENSKKSNFESKEFSYNGAKCFNIEVPNIGPARAIVYDILALNESIKIAKKNKDKAPIFYVLACRIGPVIFHFKKVIESMGGQLFVNPDGHEWLREKWSPAVRRYWKYSEKLMTKHADLLVCDSKNIEKYIQSEYATYQPKTKFIAYGTDLEPGKLTPDHSGVREWFKKHDIVENNYYLVVGRFVPENNYEAMIREFMKSSTPKSFVLITNVEQNQFYLRLKEATKFDTDSRIKFVGTVYDQDLLKYIRENAFAYFHGHEVGGTNPSLLEALAFTKMNLLLNVGFNQEVAESAAVYWEKDNLWQVINNVEDFTTEAIEQLGNDSSKRVRDYYSWPFIVEEYEKLFLNEEE